MIAIVPGLKREEDAGWQLWRVANNNKHSKRPADWRCCDGGIHGGRASCGGVGWGGGQGNESRLTSRLSENFQQVLRVPGGAFSPSFDGSVIGDLAHQIESEVADHRHVFGHVADAQSR